MFSRIGVLNTFKDVHTILPNPVYYLVMAWKDYKIFSIQNVSKPEVYYYKDKIILSWIVSKYLIPISRFVKIF